MPTPRTSSSRSRRSSPAFTVIDVAGAVATASVLLALAAVALPHSRAASNEALCSARFGSLGQGSAAFALSNNDLMAGLTWQRGGANSQYPDLNALQAQSLLNAHAAQTIDIMRRLGRPDIPATGNFLADVNYWSLALADFEGRTLADPFNVCPSHDLLMKWRRNPAVFDAGGFLPRQPAPAPSTRRWPYISSYRLTGGAFDVNQTVFTTAAPLRRLSFGTTHATMAVPALASLGPSPMSRVVSPALKVHAMDSHARHDPGLALYFAYADARQPMLFFDGSVSPRRSGDANPAWHPNSPGSGLPQTHTYAPLAWEPPTQSGAPSQSLPDRLQWTRDGLAGRDY